MEIFTSENTATAPLVVDAIYKSDRSIKGYEPISELLKCANMGGFRVKRDGGKTYKYIVLYSKLDSYDWPDSIDVYNGTVTYYGDNKTPGSELHRTPRLGNKILRDIFEAFHLGNKADIPPIFFFTRGSEGTDKVFRGLLVPGAAGIPETEDLTAIWKIKDGQRFQNYRAVFTILNDAIVQRSWIDDLLADNPETANAPAAWRQWRNSPGYGEALIASRTTDHRTRAEQLPGNASDTELLETLVANFESDPYEFEKCAAALVKMMDPNVHSCDLTRRSRDGGRDAIGVYKIGLNSNAIDVEFALEAKCYAITNSVGVRETSRLISRLRNRQFGILVTTSYVHDQAYRELLEDGHPVIIISSRDIIHILRSSGIDTPAKVNEWARTL